MPRRLERFNALFPDDDACLDWLMQKRWPNGVMCRHCQKVTRHHRVKGRPLYACDTCGTKTFPLSGTILERSTTPLRQWFLAAYVVSEGGSKITAKRLQQELGLTYATARRMLGKLRIGVANALDPVAAGSRNPRPAVLPPAVVRPPLFAQGGSTIMAEMVPPPPPSQQVPKYDEEPDEKQVSDLDILSHVFNVLGVL
jgi:hypothetical protein